MNNNNSMTLLGRVIAFCMSVAIMAVAAVVSGCKQKVPDEGVVPGKPWLLGTTSFPLEDFGYEQSEYFIKSKAHSYASKEPLSTDGKWDVEPVDEADFKTRIVVYRPIDPAKFNGTVIIEWLNVSGGTEASSEWIMAHNELMRDGYAWVGVSAQKAGIDGGGVKVLPISLALKKINPWRYSTLVHPGDKYSYDIFRQAAEAVIRPKAFKPLGDLKLKRAIAAGESQSADYLLTYVNAIAPRAKLFDGFLIHSRVHGSASLSPEPASSASLDFASRPTVKVRDDLDVPVLMLQTETDMTVLGAYPDSQPNTEMFRLWEVAGTSHADHYVGYVGLGDRGNNPKVARVMESHYAIPVLVRCKKPVNSGPQHFVVEAAIVALNKWVSTGVPAVTADRFVYDESTGMLARDQFGNVLGGIRTPYVDVPVATLSGEGQPAGNIFCSLYGTTKLFDKTTLASLYPSHEAYVSDVEQSVDSAVEKGFLLKPDGDLIKAWAQQSKIGGQ